MNTTETKTDETTGYAARLQVGTAIRGLVKVKLAVKGWSGEVSSSTMAREFEASKGAADHTAWVSLSYLPPLISRELARARGALRDEFYKNTAPFEDGGWRVVTAAGYQGLCDAIAPLAAAYRAVGDRIAASRGSLFGESAQRLGGVFNESAFPTAERLAAAYTVRLTESAVVVDARIEGLSAELNADISCRMNDRVEEQVKTAMVDVTERLRDMVCTVLGKIDSLTEGKRVVLAPFIASARAGLDGIRRANLLQDTELDKAITDTSCLLAKLEVGTTALRENGAATTDIAAKATGIKADIAKLFNAFSTEELA